MGGVASNTDRARNISGRLGVFPKIQGLVLMLVAKQLWFGQYKRSMNRDLELPHLFDSLPEMGRPILKQFFDLVCTHSTFPLVR